MNAVPRIELFEAKVYRCPMSGCWLWTGAVTRNQYGNFGINGHGSIMSAHRAAWHLYIGPIPDGVRVLHKCDTPLCVNPNHLFLGTQGDNMRDREAKGRNPGTKLTEQDVLQILADTRSLRTIAAAYGVHNSRIGRIKQKNTGGASTDGQTDSERA